MSDIEFLKTFLKKVKLFGRCIGRQTITIPPTTIPPTTTEDQFDICIYICVLWVYPWIHNYGLNLQDEIKSTGDFPM